MKNFLMAPFIGLLILNLILIFIPYDSNIKLKQEFEQKSCKELLTEFEIDLRICENKLIDTEAEMKYCKIQLRLK